MAFVYILKTHSGQYYVGSTLNLEKRLLHHFGGHTPSTLRMGVDAIVFHQKYDTLSEARLIERKIKHLKRRDYIENIIRDGYIKMKP